MKPTFFLVLGILGAQRLPDTQSFAIWMAVGTISILWHELGHAVALRAFLIPSTIELWAFGGLTKGKAQPPWEWGRLVVSLFGPLMSLALAGAVALAYRLTHPTDLVTLRVMADALWINTWWTLLNMTPILPLDGGNVMRSLMRMSGLKDPDRWASRVSVCTAAIGTGIAIAAQQWWIALMAVHLGRLSSSGMARCPHAPDSGKDDAGWKTPWVEEASAAYARGDLKAGRKLARREGNRAGKGKQTLPASMLMWGWLLEERYEEASAVADGYLRGGVMRPVVPSALAGKGLRALEHLKEAHRTHPSGALSLQLCAALLDDGDIGAARKIAEQDAQTDEPSWFINLILMSGLYAKELHQQAIEAGLRAYSIKPVSIVAYDLACCYALMGRERPALEWLERSIDRGFVRGDLMDEDPDLEPLRRTSDFARIRARVQPAPA